MANNFDKNFTEQLATGVLAAFESKRVLSKEVNTQKLDGQFNPDSGNRVRFKRPTDYTSKRTSTGDISGGDRSPIIRGEAEGVVQDYITVDVDFDEAEQSTKMGNDENEFYNSMAQRIVTDLETDFANFMMKNSALLAGNSGTAVTTWDHVAEAGAVMQSNGVPMDAWKYVVNPYAQRSLASDQRSLGGETGTMTANREATITENFAGMKVLTATTLSNFATGAGVDREGTIAVDPDVTYISNKDSLIQQISVTAFQANMTLRAGEEIKVTGVNRLNQATRKPIIDETGSQVEWTATITQDVVLDGSGAGVILVTGPAIFEATGGYNTVDRAPITGDVVTLLAPVSSIVQPNMFFHRDAFSIGSVPMRKLFSTDTMGMTKDGLQLRVSKYADGDANKQIVRIDLRPAYAVLNPFFAGHGYGS